MLWKNLVELIKLLLDFVRVDFVGKVCGVGEQHVSEEVPDLGARVALHDCVHVTEVCVAVAYAAILMTHV